MHFVQGTFFDVFFFDETGIVLFYLSVMSTPRHERDIDALASPHVGIQHIVISPEEWFLKKSTSHTHLPVENYHPPSTNG